MMRAVLVALALIGLFIFPYPLTALLSFLAALWFPFLGLALGCLAELLYYTKSSAHLPLALLLGAFGFLIGLLVQRFVKPRIIQG